jgi:hypothetical protein
VDALPQQSLDQSLDKVRQLFRGNGVPDSAILLKSSDGGILDFEAFVTWRVTHTLSEKHMSGQQKGRIVASESQLRTDIMHMTGHAGHDPVFRDAVKEQLQARRDIGFASNGETIAPKALTQTLVVHKSCASCQGSKGVSCEACYGSGQTPCLKCDGRREMACTACNGTCTVPSNNGRISCPRCTGSGRTWCTFCKGTGKIACRKCQSAGRIVCRNCGGSGIHSLVATVQFSLTSAFIYDRDNVPADAQALIDSRLSAMMADADISFIEDPARLAELQKQPDPTQLIVPYRVRLPFGTIVFSIAGHDVTAKLFGKQGLLLDMPPILEKMAGKGLKSLASLSTSPKHASKAMKDAMRYRLVADIVHTAALNLPTRAYTLLHRKYAFGIRDQALKASLANAYRGITVLTRVSKLSGIAAGLAAASIFYAVSYIGPLKSTFVASLPDTVFSKAGTDFAIAMAGILLATIMIQLITSHALRSIFPPGQKTRRKVASKWRRSLLWGFAGSTIAYGLILYVAQITGHAAPAWFTDLLRLIIS